MAPPNVLENTTAQVVKILKSPGCHMQPVFVESTEAAVEIGAGFGRRDSHAATRRICPIFQISNVTGKGIDHVCACFVHVISGLNIHTAAHIPEPATFERGRQGQVRVRPAARGVHHRSVVSALCGHRRKRYRQQRIRQSRGPCAVWARLEWKLDPYHDQGHATETVSCIHILRYLEILTALKSVCGYRRCRSMCLVRIEAG